MIVHNDIPNRLIKSLSILCTHSNVNDSLLLRKIALIKIELMMINLSKKKNKLLLDDQLIYRKNKSQNLLSIKNISFVESTGKLKLNLPSRKS